MKSNNNPLFEEAIECALNLLPALPRQIRLQMAISYLAQREINSRTFAMGPDDFLVHTTICRTLSPHEPKDLAGAIYHRETDQYIVPCTSLELGRYEAVKRDQAAAGYNDLAAQQTVLA